MTYKEQTKQLIVTMLQAKDNKRKKQLLLARMIVENIEITKTFEKILQKNVNYHFYLGRKINFIDLRELKQELEVLNELKSEL